eukprot:EG_transcript_35709
MGDPQVACMHPTHPRPVRTVLGPVRGLPKGAPTGLGRFSAFRGAKNRFFENFPKRMGNCTDPPGDPNQPWGTPKWPVYTPHTPGPSGPFWGPYGGGKKGFPQDLAVF